MPTKRKTRKADGGRNIIVNVKVGGESKPKRRRRVARRPKSMVGSEGISRPAQTGVQYLPPLTAPSQVLSSVDPFRNEQTRLAIEDLKRTEDRLVKRIEDATQQQIVQYVGKQQGAEQRSELARLGAFDPFSTSQYAQPPVPFGDSATGAQPPSLRAMMKPERPMVEEPSEALPFADYPFLGIEDITNKPEKSKRKPKLKVVEKLPTPPAINEIDESPQIQPVVEEPTIAETMSVPERIAEIEKSISDKSMEAEKKKLERRDAYYKSEEYYTDYLQKEGFPSKATFNTDREAQKQVVYDLWKAIEGKRRGKISVDRLTLYYGIDGFFAAEKKRREGKEPRKRKPKSKDLPDIEASPILPQSVKDLFNLGKQP